MNNIDKIRYLENHESYRDENLFYERKMINSTKTIPVSDIVDRFIEVDKYFGGESWTLKQILTNIHLIVPVEDRTEKLIGENDYYV